MGVYVRKQYGKYNKVHNKISENGRLGSGTTKPTSSGG